jgi:hypothetical protein
VDVGCRRAVGLVILGVVASGCGAANDADRASCRAQPMVRPAEAPALGVRTGLGAALTDWAATHEAGYRAPCERSGTGAKVYYFKPLVEPDVHGDPRTYRYRVVVRRDRVVSVQINFRNQQSQLVRGEGFEQTTRRAALVAAQAELPEGAYFAPGELVGKCSVRSVVNGGMPAVAAFWYLPRSGLWPQHVHSVLLTLATEIPFDGRSVCRGSLPSKDGARVE